MSEEKISKALKYAEATSKIEDLHLEIEELSKIKTAIVTGKSSSSFLKSIVEKTGEMKNGKTK